MLKATLIGTGGTMPLPERALASLVVSVGGRNILIDCGEGAQVAAKNAGISLFKIDLICITHYHGDHIFGLPGLLQTMGSLGKETPVLIIGPVGLAEMMKPILYLCQGLPFEVQLQEFCAEVALEEKTTPESAQNVAAEREETSKLAIESGQMPAPNLAASTAPEQGAQMQTSPLQTEAQQGVPAQTAPVPSTGKPLSKKQAALAAQVAADAAIKAKSAGETVKEIAGLPITLTAFPLSHRVPCVGYKITLPRVGKFQPQKALALGVPQRSWARLQKGEDVLLEDGVTCITPSQVLGEARSGLSVVYGTDTRICKGLHLAAKDADLLICDSTYPSDEYKEKAKEFGHSTFPQVAKLAAAQGAKRLWLTHFSAAIQAPEEHLENATAHFAAAEIGFDGKSIDLIFEE